MTEEKAPSRWNELNAAGVVEAMLADRNSVYWSKCSELARYLLAARFPNIEPHLREEIAQDCMLLICKKLATFQGKGKFTAWLAQIVRHRAIDVLRLQKKKQQSEVSTDALPETPENDVGYLLTTTSKQPSELLLLKERFHEVCALLEEYIQTHAKPERNRQILQLHFFDGHNQEQVAQLLRVHAPVVGYIIRSAREYVLQRLSQQDSC